MSKSIEQQVFSTLVNQAVKGVGETWADFHERHVAALSRAGLLVSKRDVLCRKLADAAADYFRERDAWSGIKSGDHKWDALCAESRALLAYDREHAPKPRYCIFGDSVYDTNIGYGVSNAVVYNSPDREKREAVAAALNALAEKEATRAEVDKAGALR